MKKSIEFKILRIKNYPRQEAKKPKMLTVDRDPHEGFCATIDFAHIILRCIKVERLLRNQAQGPARQVKNTGIFKPGLLRSLQFHKTYSYLHLYRLIKVGPKI